MSKFEGWLQVWRIRGVDKYTFPDGTTIEFSDEVKLRKLFKKYADKVVLP